MDDEGTRKGGEWAQAGERLGGHTVMIIGARCKRPCHAKPQRKIGGRRGEVREILASRSVKGGYRKLL